MVAKHKIKKETVIRSAILILAIVNNGLALFGKSPLPIDDVTLTKAISFIFTTASALWAWWKNNSFTQNALIADKYLSDLKEFEAVKEKEETK